MLSKVYLPTVAVLALGVFALAVGAKFGVDREYLAALGGVLLALASAMKPLLKGEPPNAGLFVVGFSVLLGYAMTATACTPAGRWHAANVVLDVLQCVLANEAKPDAEVVALCAADNVNPDDVRKILAQHRAALASERERAAAIRCDLRDGGADDGGR